MIKAYWTQRTHLFTKDEYECSKCHALCDEPYVICPNCHADMGKIKYDGAWIDEMADYDEMFDDD